MINIEKKKKQCTVACSGKQKASISVVNIVGESVGNVPRLRRPSQNWLKRPGFVELDAPIILV